MRNSLTTPETTKNEGAWKTITPKRRDEKSGESDPNNYNHIQTIKKTKLTKKKERKEN